MEMLLLVRNKLEFVDETCTTKQYEKNVFQLRQWDHCNAIVHSWIQSSVAKELKKRNCVLFKCTEVYFSNLNVLWDEFESIIPKPCDCEKSKTFVEFLRQQKLMKFLIGLNDVYAPQMSQILMMQPTPLLDQAYSMIVQEESQRLSSGYGTQ
ncbi:uncharacterized protein [Nicotiana sylvestris]|uniref:uncharacterized protein n=1 Tax=Nicotiana sylvestris TaxID=4096 RepID=UPI00388C6D4B